MDEWENGDFENESIDGSDEEAEEDDRDDQNEKSSPFARFYVKSLNANALVYKRIFLSSNKFTLARLKDLQSKEKTCAILAVGAGHFAGAGIYACMYFYANI